MAATKRQVTRTDYDGAKAKAESLQTSVPGSTSWSGRLYLVGSEWKQFFDLMQDDAKKVRAVYYHPDGGMDIATDYMRHLILGDVQARDGN